MTIEPLLDDNRTIIGWQYNHYWMTIKPSLDDNWTIIGWQLNYYWMTIEPLLDDNTTIIWMTIEPLFSGILQYMMFFAKFYIHFMYWINNYLFSLFIWRGWGSKFLKKVRKEGNGKNWEWKARIANIDKQKHSTM